MEEEIIQPIDKELLKSELTPEKQLRMTNKSHNEIYIVTANDSPNVLKEIGRLREIAFREAGGGTGKSMDLDDTGSSHCVYPVGQTCPDEESYVEQSQSSDLRGPSSQPPVCLPRFLRQQTFQQD